MNEATPNMLHGLSGKLADFTLSLNLSWIPAKVLDNAKIAILDCLEVATLATSQEVGQSLLSFARTNTSQGPCTVWGTGLTASARDSAFINGAILGGVGVGGLPPNGDFKDDDLAQIGVNALNF